MSKMNEIIEALRVQGARIGLGIIEEGKVTLGNNKFD